jgi:hypothetical protein
MKIIDTYPTTTPYEAALKFSAILSADKGVPNEIEPHGDGFVVVADDGRAVEFSLETKPNAMR